MATSSQRKAYRRIKQKARKTAKSRKAYSALKAEAVEYKGGSCVICGYNKCHAAMDFHHPDPGLKQGTIGDLMGSEASRQIIWAELDRTVLLCAICHRETHAGLHPEYLKR